MQLTLVKKPLQEIISLEEVKNYLRIDHDFDDNLLRTLISSTRAAMEAIIQKSIMIQTWEYVLNIDSLADFYSENTELPTISYGVINIPLPKPPVIKIVELTAGGTVINAEHYALEKINTKFCLCFAYRKIMTKNSMFPIVIRYEAGIADKIENVPYQLKLANLMLIANAYQERYSYNQNSIISQGIKQLLTPFLNLRIF